MAISDYRLFAYLTKMPHSKADKEVIRKNLHNAAVIESVFDEIATHDQVVLDDFIADWEQRQAAAKRFLRTYWWYWLRSWIESGSKGTETAAFLKKDAKAMLKTSKSDFTKEWYDEFMYMRRKQSE